MVMVWSYDMFMMIWDIMMVVAYYDISTSPSGLNIHRTWRGPTLIKPHSLVELAGSLVLAFIYILIGTLTTEHTNINNTNNTNNKWKIKPPSLQNFSRASLNTEKPHCFAWSRRSSASFGEGQHTFQKWLLKGVLICKNSLEANAHYLLKWL